MKLAEAIILRNDLQKRAIQVQERAVHNSRAVKGNPPAEDPQALLTEYMAIISQLEEIIPLIHRTNITTVVEGGLTLTDLLNQRDMLDMRLSTLRKVANAASLKDGYYNRDVTMVPALDVGEIQRQIDALAKARRELDARIQQMNWLTELVTVG